MKNAGRFIVAAATSVVTLLAVAQQPREIRPVDHSIPFMSALDDDVRETDIMIGPGEFSWYRREDRLISATFMLKKHNGEPRAALRTGGACLIFQEFNPPVCDATTPCEGDANHPGLCLSDPISVGPRTKSCWKTEGRSCVRFPITNLVENVRYQTAVVWAKPSTRWKVLTCQNASWMACGDMTVSPENRIIRVSDVAWTGPLD